MYVQTLYSFDEEINRVLELFFTLTAGLSVFLTRKWRKKLQPSRAHSDTGFQQTWLQLWKVFFSWRAVCCLQNSIDYCYIFIYTDTKYILKFIKKAVDVWLHLFDIFAQQLGTYFYETSLCDCLWNAADLNISQTFQCLSLEGDDGKLDELLSLFSACGDRVFWSGLWCWTVHCILNQSFQAISFRLVTSKCFRNLFMQFRGDFF